MEIDDRYVTAVPEGVHLEVVLGGLGSRFCAYLIDFIIQVAALAAVLIAWASLSRHTGETGGLIAAGAFALFLLVDFIGYFVLFEMLWSGRSPGKRLTGIRVVKAGGQAVGFWASLLRNLGRLLDVLPSMNALGVVMILATTRNQRLGDLMAGTVVVRESVGVPSAQAPHPWSSGNAFQSTPGAPWAWAPSPFGAPWLPPELAHWDVSAVPGQELALLQTFLANRNGYTPDARQRLALDLANRLWPFVAGPSSLPPPEVFLEMVAQVKAVRG
ncbi:MAG: RDD family protein [Acidimicrobiales bacterium]